jgi:hypothetical protein
MLDNSIGNTKVATYGGMRMDLKWEFNKLISISSKDNSDFDFKVDYAENNKIIGISANKLINGVIQTVCRPQFENGKLVKTIKYENEKGGSQWIRAIKTITYTDTATLVECLTYFTGRPNTLKNSSTLKGVYKFKNGKSFITVQPYYNQVDETFYDESENIVRRLSINKFKIADESFYYDEAKNNYKREIIEKNLDGTFIVRNVIMESIPKNQNSNVPPHEKTVGGYKFNGAGELIYEAIGGKYRNKINGVWEDWKYFRM